MSVVGASHGIMLRGRLNRILLEAWFTARGGEIMPHRDELAPAALKLAMPLLLIFDYGSADEILCRMMGTRLRQFLGFEMTGLNILSVGQGALRERRRARFRACAEQPCGMAAASSITIAEGASREIEFLMLPVRADHGVQLFAIISAIGEEIEFPRGAELTGATPLSSLMEDVRFINLGAGMPALP